jgi:hypothetical protein
MSRRRSFMEISEKFLCPMVGSIMEELSLAEDVGKRSVLQEEARRTDPCFELQLASVIGPKTDSNVYLFGSGEQLGRASELQLLGAWL